MSLYFHKKPIISSAVTLKNLVARYREYTAKVDYPTADEESYEKCRSAIALLKSSIRQIKEGRENLQKLYEEVREEYRACKSKSDKKDIILEIEQIEEESNYHSVMADADELGFMLSARLDEATCARDRMDVKLGYITQRAQRALALETEDCGSLLSPDEDLERNSSQAVTTDASSGATVTGGTERTRPQRGYRSIKPPQASLPKFYGKAEEFSEFWAVYKTLVHECDELETIEKLILLRECLEGRAKVVIQGIQPLPENYEWMVETLQETYCDHSANRSQIIQTLASLAPAKDQAESCSITFDKIQVLVNQMVSAGYDVRKTCDPMWCETILAKFPREIVKPVLIASQAMADLSIKDLLGHLKKEIAAKCYVENRLGHAERRPGYEPTNKVNLSSHRQNTRPTPNEVCIFCHRRNHVSAACRTVTDPSSRRQTMKDGNRCWKCFSAKHNSFDCQMADCIRCGQKHHVSLCVKKEQNDALRQNNSRNTNFRYNREEMNARRSDQGNTRAQQPSIPQRNPRVNGGLGSSNDLNNRRNFSNNTHMRIDRESPQSSGEQQGTSQLVLMTAEGNLWNHSKQEYNKVLFFFDSGAQKTVIEEKIADEFGLPKITTELCTMSGIGGHVENFRSHVVTAKLSTAFGEEVELKIQTKPILTNGFPGVKLTSTDIAFLKENNICLANSKLRGESQTPHILVGLDYYHELVSGPNHMLKTPSGLHIARTIFGPTVYGKGLINADNISSNYYYGMTALSEPSEQKMLRNMFELEGLGISEGECQNDDKTLKYLKEYSKKISFENGHITAPFPLKENISQLGDNYGVAIRRLESLQKTLQLSPNQRDWYSKILDKYVEDSTIEIFSEADSEAVGTYYMPHSGVWKPNKKVPLRIVFDASSKRRDALSLNDVIHKGESFINKIHDILISSRKGNIILMCDIEAAFTQIRLVNSHKDLCRFLWVKNIDLPPTRDNLIHYRFRRLPFGITASPSILNMALTSYLDSLTSPLAEEIAKSLYVDNVMMLASTKEEALMKYHQSKELFARIGMNLREYISNSPHVNSRIPKEDRLESDCLKILGVRYNMADDAFKVVTNFQTATKLTKRDIVSQINSVYDPVGLAGPLLVHLKSMMREVFEMSVDWKTHLDSTSCQKWNRLCSEVSNATITVSRPLSSPGAKLRLWVFADASKVAIATCAYGQNIQTRTISGLISGKTRLTPKKCHQTIPRLELLGLFMATRLCNSILSNMRESVDSISLVTDSEIALWWMKSPKKLPVFVVNLRQRIKDTTNVIESKGIPISFFHVQTSYNPADAGTRGLTAQSIVNHDWVQGPRWLEAEPSTWPIKSMESIVEIPFDEGHKESLTLAETSVEPSKKAIDLIDLARFSKLKKALRVVALVGKIAKCWVESTNKNRFSHIKLVKICQFTTTREITSVDIERAERVILIQEQSLECIESVQKRFSDKKIICDPEGIIRHESRLQNAALPRDTKSPIYIPPKSELIRLLVRQIHNDNAHCGKEHTLTIARQRFWIPRASNAFKAFLKNCATCKKYQGLPLGAPLMPSLPSDRVIETKPFQNTGCDFLGPFVAKTQEKMYVALYTCLTTRAVHLEVVENMSTGAFLNSFIRFISRRGTPKIMRTDCGTNFKQGEQIIATMFEKDGSTGQSLMTYCASERIKWLFNPPASPWMGGVWERLVASVKKGFNKAVGRKKLSFTEMCTIIARIEAIINTRPLTKVCLGDITKIPLRPIDFLQGNVKFSLPEGGNREDEDDPSYDPDLIQSRRQAQEAIRFSENVANKFWDCWKHEYLVSLRDMQKQHLKQPRHLQRVTPEIGEIVLIEQDQIPRGAWPYGRVTDIIPSADGLVRSVKILTPNHKIIHRPLNKIYPLEIRSFADGDNTGEILTRKSTDPSSEPNPEEPSTTICRSEKVPSRQPIPRASKARAHEFFKNMDCAISHKRSFPTTFSFLCITLLSLISSTCATNASTLIWCASGTVHIPPIAGRLEVCIDSECQRLINTSQPTTYILPISPTGKDATVLLKTFEEGSIHDEEGSIHEQTLVCDRANFCDHQYFLSKTLLGNPHCWPVGAIATTAILIYMIIVTVMCIVWTVLKTVKIRKTKGSTNVVAKRKVESPQRAPPCVFELAQIPGTVLTVCVVLCLLAPATACQHGIMRHSADLVCNEKGQCHLEYTRELLFNRLQSELCIEIWHANRSVGIAKFVKKTIAFKCSKVTEFYTRPSTMEVHHAKRCVNAGSCIDDKCDKMNPKETVSELNHTLKYPGYSGCMSSCGGVFCGCLLPLPSCWFYRVAHRPTSKRIFEIVRCPHWSPTITLDIEISMANQTKKYTQSFEPYVVQSLLNFNITVASIQKPTGSLENNRFAISSDKAYALPIHYPLPVACDSYTQALNNFAACSNLIECHCGNSPLNCLCPDYSIQKLRDNPQSELPLQTPHAIISAEANNIVASSNEEEMVIRIESRMLHNAAELVVNQECEFNISEITGCYNCAIGAHFTTTCKSPEHASVTVTCDFHQFLVNCGPSGEINSIMLSFDHPIVHEQCNAHCSGNPTQFQLNGSLHYHIETPQSISAFERETHGVPLKHQWFADITFPSLEPLINVVKKHWKVALGCITVTLGLVTVTYLAGPLILWVIFKVGLSIITTLLPWLWKVVLSLSKKLLEAGCKQNTHPGQHGQSPHAPAYN